MIEDSRNEKKRRLTCVRITGSQAKWRTNEFGKLQVERNEKGSTFRQSHVHDQRGQPYFWLILCACCCSFYFSVTDKNRKANTDLGLCRAQICMPGCGWYRLDSSAIHLRNQEAEDLKIDREKIMWQLVWWNQQRAERQSGLFFVSVLYSVGFSKFHS